MDDLNDEEVQLIRELKRNRKSQQRKELREQHANAQAKYRLHLAQKKAPTRNDFAIVTLDTVLRAIAASPEHALLRLLREGIEKELVKADFDLDQISIRLGKMLEGGQEAAQGGGRPEGDADVGCRQEACEKEGATKPSAKQRESAYSPGAHGPVD